MDYLIDPERWTFEAPPETPELRHMREAIDAAVAAHMRAEVARLEDEAKACVIEMARLEREHGPSERRHIARVIIEGRPIAEDHFRVIDPQHPMYFGVVDLGE